jgi:ParB family chromosome partitioning protein
MLIVGNIIELEISAIEIKFQPRSNFNEESLRELVHRLRIRCYSTITVRKLEFNKYH